MTEGLKFKVPSSELKSHLQSRAKHHADRATEKEGELPGLREALSKISGAVATANRPNPGSNVSNSRYSLDPDDPIEKLQNDIRDHRSKSFMFGFFASHLFNDNYTLKEEDLSRLEMFRRVQ